MRFKIMVNILLIEINQLLNYLYINYILLKQKLFMTQPNNLKDEDMDNLIVKRRKRII